ncbi:MAG TPA: hypothetical protein VN886_02325 [Acidimicrobiales bacterium]|nr:hypothetical protein [Acidimicrobiales bacterium]
MAEVQTRTVKVELESGPALARVSAVEDAKTEADRYRQLSLASQNPGWGPSAARGAS